ncbi:uncharacterized protein M421DRAFT_7683 [Didymella exigua CBS 183.55]|uniref:Mediator of RNA polymerase II transcription subunit 20 n=1 Tax=Didymella exigua CBS 183.55 TaxID=1150837 RepID=A0A6A5REM8_9PLEO|nr:uncharacterized protein M421DRAFT_7683 [Didymella exigua CBS 183.55]KAF1925658.1 hypothetical protein M421DRAFT_7683 [Didymella exigua CBS 183.55]
MKYSGLYFIPTPTAQPADSSTTAAALVSALETLFPTLSRAAPWSLVYRLFRDTAPRTDPSDTPAQHAHTYQHILTNTALAPQRAYVHVTPPATGADGSQHGTGVVAAIPASQAEARALLLRHQLAALWTPRHTLSVQSGAAYSGGLFTIHIGEVRALREGQGGGVSSPGVVVCIATTAGGDSEAGHSGGEKAEAEQNGVEAVDFEFAQATIRELWGQIRARQEPARAEVKEVFMVPQEGGTSDETNATVRMWCEVLRLRG